MVARRAHNPEVAGSSPVPATTKPVNRMVGRLFCCAFAGYETGERARWAENPTAASGGNREDFLAQRSAKASGQRTAKPAPGTARGPQG